MLLLNEVLVRDIDGHELGGSFMNAGKGVCNLFCAPGLRTI